jgi:hypothetical protein
MEFSNSMWVYFKSLIVTATEQFNNEMDDDTYSPVPKITLPMNHFLQGLHSNNNVNASDDKVKELQEMLFKNRKSEQLKARLHALGILIDPHMRETTMISFYTHAESNPLWPEWTGTIGPAASSSTPQTSTRRVSSRTPTPVRFNIDGQEDSEEESVARHVRQRTLPPQMFQKNTIL